jgi:hypothetical protein
MADRSTVKSLVFWLIILVLALLVLLPDINKCHAAGGTVVRGLIGLECVR